MADGQKITFSGEGDQEPGLEPGDIIIVLDEKEHGTFKRSGTDLIMKFNINITEALCGFKKTVTTLDDRTLVIQTIPGKLALLPMLKSLLGLTFFITQFFPHSFRLLSVFALVKTFLKNDLELLKWNLHYLSLQS